MTILLTLLHLYAQEMLDCNMIIVIYIKDNVYSQLNPIICISFYCRRRPQRNWYWGLSAHHARPETRSQLKEQNISNWEETRNERARWFNFNIQSILIIDIHAAWKYNCQKLDILFNFYLNFLRVWQMLNRRLITPIDLDTKLERKLS